MGVSLGRLWAKRGHNVMFSYSRLPEKLRELVKESGSGARSGTPHDAAGFGRTVFLAVPWAAIGDALVAGPLDGRILISCVKPPGPKGLEVGLLGSAAEEISKLAPGAIETVGARFVVWAEKRPSDLPEGAEQERTN